MNRKGMTLVEIILSISITGIVFVLFISLLNNIKTRKNDVEKRYDMLYKESRVMSLVNDDFIKYNLTGIKYNCNYADFLPSYTIQDDGMPSYIKASKANGCILFEYGVDNQKGLLMFFNYDDDVLGTTDDNWGIMYLRSDFTEPENTNYKGYLTEHFTNLYFDNDIYETIRLNDQNIFNIKHVDQNAVTIKLPLYLSKTDKYDITLSYLSNTPISVSRY